MTHIYKARITYCVNPETHPDFACMTDWFIGRVYDYEDTYNFSDEYSEEEVTEYIKRDLKLVAGGGYDTRGIYSERIYINGRLCV